MVNIVEKLDNILAVPDYQVLNIAESEVLLKPPE